MIIDAHTFCWNEEVRLEYFLRQYSPICRHIYIYDNGSTDKSKQVADSYTNTVWDTSTYGQEGIDDKILLWQKNNAWKKTSRDADLVFVGDIDEIVYHPRGLALFFEKALELGYTVLQPYGYDMISRNIPTHEGNIYDLEEFRVGEKHVNGNRMDKCVTFSPKQISEIKFEVGAHGAKPSSIPGLGQVKFLRDPDYKLLHYKYLGREEFAKRHVECSERLCKKNLAEDWGKHYKGPLEQHLATFDTRFNRSVKII